MSTQVSDVFHRRSAGLLLHITSLAGPHGSGDLGGTEAVLEFAEGARLGWWQVLPVHPPNGFASPYQSPSSFAGHADLIDLASLQRFGWISRAKLRSASLPQAEHCDFAASRELRERLLRLAFLSFEKKPHARYKKFCRDQAHWLEDWCLFAALRAEHSGAPWQVWTPDLRDRQPTALRHARQRLGQELRFHSFVQFVFDENWHEFRRRAESSGVRLLGDLPMFVAADSADAWVHRQLFHLDEFGKLEREAGTPPDAFSKHGQRWGVPTYRTAGHRRTGYAWWIARVRRELELFDALRLDHFIGYARTYSIRRERGSQGRYEKGLGRGLFSALRTELGPLPFVVEDLGDAGPDVQDLRERFGFPGTQVLQFGLDGLHGDNPYLPHNWERSTVAYTGTHDNPTTVGWFRAHATKPGSRSRPGESKRSILEYSGGKGSTIHSELVRVLWTSVANTVIVPVQDFLGLGSESRMNIPGRAGGNWSWRMPADALGPELAESLFALGRMTGRVSQPQEHKS